MYRSQKAKKYIKKKENVKKIFSDRKQRDLKKLIEHSKHHSKAHIAFMRKLINEGVSFSTAHNKAFREIGK